MIPVDSTAKKGKPTLPQTVPKELKILSQFGTGEF
jgi:hypothetical protein